MIDDTHEAPLRSIIFARILVGVDFSQDCRSALECAVAMARSGASLTLLHVCEPFPVLNTIVPGADNTDDERSEQRLARTHLDGLREWLADHGFTSASVEVETGRPAEVLVARAKSGKFDVVVMGTHGRSGMSRLLLGSVAESVLRRAPCPVVTVRLPPEPSR